jgi:hypothetical protein
LAATISGAPGTAWNKAMRRHTLPTLAHRAGHSRGQRVNGAYRARLAGSNRAGINKADAL